MIYRLLLTAVLLCCARIAGADAGAEDPALMFLQDPKPQEDVKVYLPVSRAFVAEASVDEKSQRARITITPAKGYYLYRSKISATAADGSAVRIDLPAGIEHTDDFMGTQIVYYVPLSFTADLRQDLTVTYQGCTNGMCYPPQKLTVKAPAATPAQPQQIGPVRSLKEIPATESAPERSYLHDIREALIFLLVGLSLSFTPCVFPMYPVLSMLLFGRSKEHQQNRRTFAISCFFVLGIALTYTAIGVVSSYFGAQTHAFLQQKFILILFSAIFVLLSLSMLGLFTVQIPTFLSARLQKIADEQHSGSLTGAFTVGVITSLICSPCTTAPVSASILYTIQAGNVVLGTADLFLLGLGMGVPMLALGAFGKKVLPKAGRWLDLIKHLIGIFSLMVPFVLLDRILPHWVLPSGIIVLFCCAVMTAIHHVRPKLTLAFLPLVLAAGLVAGWYVADFNGAQVRMLKFTEIANLAQLKEQLAKNDGKKVLIDFYASWCASCRQYEEETFASRAVQRALDGYTLIRVDLSESSSENQSITDQFNLVGLPSVMIGEGGKDLKLLSGFYDSKNFLKELKRQQAVSETRK
ncbi:MAG: protein-disulfide reductase DsbD [Succinivibrionaceae bacterium]|nr:protein-disulfide reductase DsbD [Succinivibrionaceae bacterium]